MTSAPPTPRRFDALVIGAGQAGPPLAARLAAAGRSVAIVERGLFGGTCVNTGCTPTKTLVASAHVAHMARRAAEYGIGAGPVSVDFAAVMARKDRVVAASRDGVENWLRATPGCTVLTGHARFLSPTRVQVGDEVLEAAEIFLNVGGRALIPDFPGIAEVEVLTNTTILSLAKLSTHLVIVGGSYIGVEFAQIFRRLGAAVTLVEKGPRLVAREDPEISAAIREILESEGVAVRCDATCIRFAAHPDGAAVGVDCTDGAPEVVGSHVLLAVGRKPNTADLGLDAAGVTLDARGYVQVDDSLRSTAPHIWALGDCNGRGAFTHTAYNDYEIVAENLLDAGQRRVTDRIPAYALYTDPPLGRVGLSEAEARAAGYRIRIGARPMTRVSRAVEKGETAGLMKLVVDADTDAILGAAILGVGGDEAIHAVIVAMQAGTTAGAYTRAVPIHPTVAELIPTVFGELKP